MHTHVAIRTNEYIMHTTHMHTTHMHTCTHTHAHTHTHTLNHQYLHGQFYHDRAYREGEHWERLCKLGSGKKATCFVIADKCSNSLLVLKEVQQLEVSIESK